MGCILRKEQFGFGCVTFFYFFPRSLFFRFSSFYFSIPHASRMGCIHLSTKIKLKTNTYSIYLNTYTVYNNNNNINIS